MNWNDPDEGNLAGIGKESFLSKVQFRGKESRLRFSILHSRRSFRLAGQHMLRRLGKKAGW